MSHERALVAKMIRTHYGRLDELGDEYPFAALEYLPQARRVAELEILLEHAIERAWLERALAVAQLLGRNLTPAQLRTILNKQIRRGGQTIDRLRLLTQQMGREPTVRELIINFRSMTKYRHGINENALDVAKQLPAKHRKHELEHLLKRVLRSKDCYFEDARLVARWLKRRLSKEQIRQCLQREVRRGYFTKALEIARVLRRKLRTPELISMYRVAFKNDWPDSEIDRVLNVLPPPIRTRKLKELLAQAVSLGRCTRSKHLAQQLGRDLTTKELIALFEVSMAKCRSDKAKEIFNSLVGRNPEAG
jgi:hypothetical protein